MKKKICFWAAGLLCGLALLPAPAEAQRRELHRPAFLVRQGTGLELRDAMLSDTATTLTFRFPGEGGMTWTCMSGTCLWAGTDSVPLRGGRLFDSRTGSSFPLVPDSAYICFREAEGGRYELTFDSVRLDFGPLPAGTKRFDFRFAKSRGRGRIAGIRTDGRQYKPALPKSRRKVAGEALPDWKPRSGRAVLRGRVYGYDPKMMDFSYYGNEYSLTNDPWDLHFTKDSLGNYRFETELAYPIHIHMWMPGGGYSILLRPGDEVVMDMDLPRRSRFNYASEEEQAEAAQACVRRSGGLPEADRAERKANPWKKEISAFHRDTCQAHLNDTFEQFVEGKWQNHLRRLAEVDADPTFSPAEREYLRLFSEFVYIKARESFLSTKRFARTPPDSAALAAFAAQMTYADGHAGELQFPHTLKGTYIVHDRSLHDYFAANNLLDTPMGRWTQGLGRARETVKRLQMLRPVTDEAEWAGVDTIYLPQLRQLNEQVLRILAEKNTEARAGKAVVRDLPDCAPADYLRQIVAGHTGRVVLIDFWATWCGPCRQGMKEMDGIKAELAERGVDFVYVTDESSPAVAWKEETAHHAGDHYRISSAEQKAMGIPGYTGSIPHLLVYDRKGRFVRSFRGWGEGSLAAVRAAVDEALQSQ